MTTILRENQPFNIKHLYSLAEKIIFLSLFLKGFKGRSMKKSKLSFSKPEKIVRIISLKVPKVNNKKQEQ